MAYPKLHIAFLRRSTLTLSTPIHWPALVADLNSTLFADRVRLGQHLNRVRGLNDAVAIEKLAQQIRTSKDKADHRRERLPQPIFSDDLPIANKRAQIQAAIAANQVVIVCGETGSGKTTQLPKICLELKRGVYGTIGCTQPRRIAARSVAARIAQELQTELGQLVGYKVRFTDRVQENTLIKVMTDGILLAETHSDRLLLQYDTLIIDEAHERNVNIDFLLGYLKQLLPKRPELKVIITSATIDATRFAEHFDGAPVLEVSGRVFPVDIHYRPMGEDDDDEEINLNAAIIHALDEILATPGAGDALVFLPGEREIRHAAEALRKHAIPNTEILALFARLSVAEQDRVFKPGSARRIILATNVAETSLTVPRIRYVIDSGLARINRFSQRSKINQLQIEKISRAAAKQRAGRCGRVASGICLRLYSEVDHDARPEYTTPEILRTSLAAVILRMQALALGDVNTFPFLEAPSPRSIDAGYQLLAELGAINEQHVLTSLGRDLAKLPVDPKIGRMLLAAKAENCLSEMLILTAALSVQDPRERPQDKRDAALEKHRLFFEERSDFLSYLKIWQFFEDAIKHKKSNRKLAQLCYEHFLSFIRLREWRDVHQQLHALIAEMGMRLNETAATYEQIHRALLTGLLGHVGFKDPEADNYLGARDTKFFLPQDSVLAKKKSKWIMVAELTETTKLYGRCAAEISPEWIEQIGKRLLARSYHDPHWEKNSGQVVAFERATLYGLPVISKRRVHFGPIDPQQSRELFIRGALVARDYESRAPYFAHNTKLIKEIEALEHKSRRQNVLVDDQTLYEFYDPLIPQGIYNAATFEHWRKEAERANPKLLFLSRDYLMRHSAHGVTEDLYPAYLTINGQDYPLRYRFDPSHPLDGVSLTLPLAMLNQLDVTRCDWLVPGMLREKVTALLRGLPQRIRRVFVPLAESVTRALQALDQVDPEKTPLRAALANFIEKNHRLVIANEDWPAPRDHLRMNYRVIDLAGEELAVGRDIELLRKQLGQAATTSVRDQGTKQFERDGIRSWDFGDLPNEIEVNIKGRSVLAYPGIEDQGDSIALRLFDRADIAEAVNERGIIRLCMLALSQPLRYLEKNLPGLRAIGLAYASLPDAPFGELRKNSLGTIEEELRDDVLYQSFHNVFLAQRPALRSAREFEQRIASSKSQLAAQAMKLCEQLTEVFSEYLSVQKTLAALPSGTYLESRTDIESQLGHLLFRRFVRLVPTEKLGEYPRYLKAITLRLNKLREAPQRDFELTLDAESLWHNYEKRRDASGSNATLEEYRWLLEELRVSLFAQQLRTPVPVSLKRLSKLWDEIAKAK